MVSITKEFIQEKKYLIIGNETFHKIKTLPYSCIHSRTIKKASMYLKQAIQMSIFPRFILPKNTTYIFLII